MQQERFIILKTNARCHKIHFKEFLRLLRISQWYKNLIIPAVGIFSIQIFDWTIYLFLVIGFLLACGLSSANYIINDILDIENDKGHPEKKNRPIASGTISIRTAAIIGTILFIISLGCSFLLSFWFGIVMLTFFLIAQSYTFFLKKIAFVDIIVISLNFIIRAAGGLTLVIAHLTFELGSILWPIWAVFIFALFLAVSKRKADFKLLEAEKALNHKKVYEKYQKQLLEHLVFMVATILLMGYYLYVLLNDQTGGYLLLTVPVATYLMFRYLYLLYSPDKNMGAPEKAIKDPGILIGSITVLLLFLIIRYLNSFGYI